MTTMNHWTMVNIFFIFQVSKIVGCVLEKIGQLPFTLVSGACNTFLNPTPIVLLCFDSHEYGASGANACHTYVKILNLKTS